MAYGPVSWLAHLPCAFPPACGGQWPLHVFSG